MRYEGVEPYLPQSGAPLVVTIDGEEADWLGEGLSIEHRLNAPPSCELGVRLHKGFLVNVGTPAAPQLRSLEDVLPDDALIEVFFASQDPQADRPLFVGHAERFERRATRRGYEARVQCLHEAGTIAERIDRCLVGQLRYRKGQIDWLKDHPGELDDLPPRLYRGLRCIFNPDGARNCDSRIGPLACDPDELGFTAFPLPRFTHSLDPAAQSWSWARVLLYVLYVGRWNSTDGTIGDFGDARMIDLNLAATIQAGGLHAIDPDAAGTPSDPWARLLLAKPASLVLEGRNWWEALQWCSARCGLWVRVEHVQRDGEWRIGLRFGLPGGAARKRFKLCSPGWDAAGHTRDEVTEANNVSNLVLISDRSGAANVVEMHGRPIRYETTIELAPLWAADARWDVDWSSLSPQQRDEALAFFGSEEAEVYQRSSSSFAKFDVGRLWGVCDGQERSAELARSWAPWTAERYALLDPAELGFGEFSDLHGAYTLGMGAVRPRPFEDCASGYGPSSPLPAIVQVSVDGGESWAYLPSGVAAMKRSARVYFEIDDLADEALIFKTGTGELGYVEAYLRGLLRVRVTAGMRGDDVVFTRAESSASLLARPRERLLQRPSDIRIEGREAFTPPQGGTFELGNSQFIGSAIYPEVRRNDVHKLLASADAAIERLDRVRHRGVIETPGLVPPSDAENAYQPGDEIEGVFAQAGASEHDLRMDAADGERYAVCVGVTLTYEPGERPQLQTTVQIEDASTLMRPEAGQ